MFRVLFVCTANICRSPMAERLFLMRLPANAGIEVSSAGSRALSGHPMDASSAMVLRELGGEPSGHLARQLDERLIADAGLILTATSTHRAEILREVPAAMRRTFTLREFARLGENARPDPAGSLAERVGAVGGQRGLADPGGSGDEIGDPFGASLDVVRLCGRQISDAVDGVLRILVPTHD